MNLSKPECSMIKRTIIFFVLMLQFSFLEGQTSNSFLYGTWTYQWSELKTIPPTTMGFVDKESIAKEISNYISNPSNDGITYIRQDTNTIDKAELIKQIDSKTWSIGEITWRKNLVSGGVPNSVFYSETYAIIVKINDNQFFGREFHISYHTTGVTGAGYYDIIADRVSSSSSSSQDPDIPWTVVIGTLTAAAVAGIVARLRKKAADKRQAKSNTRDRQDRQKEAEEAHYILQLSEERFILKLGEPAPLHIKVWKVTSAGYSAYPANIQILCFEKSLSISAVAGVGSLSTHLTLTAIPLQPDFNIMVTASAAGYPVRKAVSISTVCEKSICVKTLPEERKLRAGVFELLALYAKVVDGVGKDLPEDTKKLLFVPRSNWIDLSESVMIDNSQALNLGLSNPDPSNYNPDVPESVTLEIVLEAEEQDHQRLSQNLVIQVLNCELRAEIYECTFPDSNESVELLFKAEITDHPGDLPWQFSASYKRGDQPIAPLTDIELINENEYTVTVRLIGPAKNPMGADHYLRETLVIEASQKDELPLRAEVAVIVMKTGLMVRRGLNADNVLAISANEKIERQLDFAITAIDPQTNEVKVYESGLSSLTFELLTDDQQTLNVASVLKPEFEFLELLQANTLGRYRFTTQEKIPGGGDEFLLKYLVRSSYPVGADPGLYELELTAKVITEGIGHNYPEWDEICRQIEYMIESYVPKDSDAGTKLLELYYDRRNLLGVEGLVEMRNQIWKIAQNLILAEGAKGYESMERWASAITTTLEWAEWAGDIAFTAVIAFKSPQLSLPVGIGKSVLIDAVKFTVYEEDQPFSVFINRQLDMVWDLILGATKGRYISVDYLEKLLKGNKPVAYAAYIALNFGYNLFVNKMTIYDAAKATLKQVTEEVLVQFLVGKLKEDSLRVKRKIVNVHEALEDVVKNIDSTYEGLEGWETIKQDKLLEYMRDTQMTRTIKKHGPPWLKKIFNDSKQKIYREHDQLLREAVAKKYPTLDVSDLKVEDIRTPGSDPNDVNTDRDYRLMRNMKASNGTTYGIEISPSLWQDISFDIFAKITKKPGGAISNQEWANHHKQTPTNRTHAEASADYSDQVFRNGRWEQGESNYCRVTEGTSKLIDPKGLGDMYVNKVAHENNASEKVAQAKKSIKALNEITDGYKKQNLEVKEPDMNLKKAMEVIIGSATDVTATPQALESMNEQLKGLNYNGVEDVVKAVAKKISEFPT